MGKFIQINFIYSINPDAVTHLEIVDPGDLKHSWLNVYTHDGRQTQGETGDDPYALRTKILEARDPSLKPILTKLYNRNELTNGPYPESYAAKNNSGEDPNPTTEEGQRPAAAALG